MNKPVLLITPPFTQLNTPYPATAYLKGFFNTKGIESVQADLGIEVTITLFSKAGLEKLLNTIDQKIKAGLITEISENSARIISLKDRYIHTINEVILFLH